MASRGTSQPANPLRAAPRDAMQRFEKRVRLLDIMMAGELRSAIVENGLTPPVAPYRWLWASKRSWDWAVFQWRQQMRAVTAAPRDE